MVDRNHNFNRFNVKYYLKLYVKSYENDTQ